MYVTCTCKRILTTSRGPTTNREIIPARAPAVACRTALLPFFLVLPPDSGITAPPMLVGEEKKKKRSGEEGCGVASPVPVDPLSHVSLTNMYGHEDSIACMYSPIQW